MKKKNKTLWFEIKPYVILFLCLFGLDVLAQSNLESLEKRANISNDVVYKKINDTLSLKMDLYIPKVKSEKKFPVVVQIHGGGWAFGDKSIPENTFVEYAIEDLLNAGIAVASIQYRLVSKTSHFPSPIEDCKDAVKWLRKNATQYHLDGNNIGLWGNSAGAHLAMLTAYTKDDIWQGADELKTYSSEVSYVINAFGPTDLNKSLQTHASAFLRLFFSIISPELLDIRQKLIRGVTELDIDEDKDEIIYLCRLYSPISYGAQAVPTLTLHGTSDRIVPFSHATLLDKVLKEHQIKHTFVSIKKADHGFNKVDEQERKNIAWKITEFALAH